ncbi:MAG: TetR/AcrR family transcriptional regulator [Rubrobacter sp.]|nr:TetR/AcrR family transcriptional regulator [Rubrobacter sp.]MBA3951725.1 TetR/AcrR family transcriptional regulator [Rubrobacter sp.]MDQ3376307.1 TetR/AcrR family transcriptional regulator [Actinomycetota bacterium]
MSEGPTPPIYRKSSLERREAVLDAAVVEFAERGLHGASTETIAGRAGISQPYVFKLFGTKKDLFLAAVDRVCDRIVEAWEDSLKSDPEDPLLAMGEAFVGLTVHREELLLVLQACAASKDPDVLGLMRGRMERMYDYVARATGEPDEHVQAFFAQGMLLTVGAGLALPEMAQESDWARRFLGLEKGWALRDQAGSTPEPP